MICPKAVLNGKTRTQTLQSSTACTSSMQDFNIPQEDSVLGLTDRSLLKHRLLLLYQIFKYYFPNIKNNILNYYTKDIQLGKENY